MSRMNESCHIWRYGVATISKLLTIIGLFCKRGHAVLPVSLRCHAWYRRMNDSCDIADWMAHSEYRLFYRALLQKRPILLRSLLIVNDSCDIIDWMAHSEYRLFYRALLQKRPIILSSWLIVNDSCDIADWMAHSEYRLFYRALLQKRPIL